MLAYSALVRAGAAAAGTLKGFEKFLKGSQRGSFLPKAPGGGTENVGIVQAVNDMLVQSNGKFIMLFPAWDRTQDASFSSLLVKGAVEVSASWSAKDKAVGAVTVLARKEHAGDVVFKGLDILCSVCPVGCCCAGQHIGNLRAVQGSAGADCPPATALGVKCADGSTPILKSVGDLSSFTAPPGVKCLLREVYRE